MRRLLIASVLLGTLLVLAQASALPAALPAGSWVGTYSVGGSDTIAFSIAGKRAVVALGAGHAEAQTVSLSVRGSGLRFQLPGRPQPVIFTGTVRGGKIVGTARQGSVHGVFRARHGTALAPPMDLG